MLRKEGNHLQGKCAPSAGNRISSQAHVPATSGRRVFTITEDGPERRHFVNAVLEDQETKARL